MAFTTYLRNVLSSGLGSKWWTFTNELTTSQAIKHTLVFSSYGLSGADRGKLNIRFVCVKDQFFLALISHQLFLIPSDIRREILAPAGFKSIAISLWEIWPNGATIVLGEPRACCCLNAPAPTASLAQTPIVTSAPCHQHRHHMPKSILQTRPRCPQFTMAASVTLLPTSSVSLRQSTASRSDHRRSPAAKTHLSSDCRDIKQAMICEVENDGARIPAKQLCPRSWQTALSVNYILPPFSFF